MPLGYDMIIKQSVVGFCPRMAHRIYGEVPEWPKGADCKSVGTAFDGSNPSLSTIAVGFCQRRICRGVEQLAARRAHNPKVGGSNPPSATKKGLQF